MLRGVCGPAFAPGPAPTPHARREGAGPPGPAGAGLDFVRRSLNAGIVSEHPTMQDV